MIYAKQSIEENEPNFTKFKLSTRFYKELLHSFSWKPVKTFCR